MKYPFYSWHNHNSQYLLAADIFSSMASGWLAVVSPAHLKLRENHHGYFLVIQDSATVRPYSMDTHLALHYNDVIIGAMASQITSLTIVY